MFFPVKVQLLEHNFFFYVTHERCTDRFGLRCINLVHLLDTTFANLVFIDLAVFLQPLRYFHLRRKLALKCVLQSLGVPLLVQAARRDVLIDQDFNDFFPDGRD